MQPETESHKGSGKRRLLLIFSIALLPIGLAYILFYFYAGSEPWASTSQGQLLKPMVSADALNLKNNQGQHQTLGDSGLWWLLVVSEEDCLENCRQALHLVRGSQVLLNKDMPRVRRAWLNLVEGGASDLGGGDQQQLIVEKYPRLRRFWAEPGALAEGVYIVDPLANIVLYYTYAEAGKPLLDDLKRLLKVSQIG